MYPDVHGLIPSATSELGVDRDYARGSGAPRRTACGAVKGAEEELIRRWTCSLGYRTSVRYGTVFTRARGHHRQRRDRPIRGYSRSALAAIEGGDLKIWYVHTTLSEASATRDEERRTRLLLAGGPWEARSVVRYRSSQRTQRRRSAAVSSRDAPYWSVISRRASSTTGVSRQRRKSQFGSCTLLGAYVAFDFGSHERCEAVFRCPNPVSRQQPQGELHWAKPRTC